MNLKDHPNYESLLEKIRQVFGGELQRLSPTQLEIADGLVMDRVRAHKGDPGEVTLDEVEGCRELLYNEFSMAGFDGV